MENNAENKVINNDKINELRCFLGIEHLLDNDEMLDILASVKLESD